MTTVLALQRALIARGYDLGPGRDDGLIGPKTLSAALDAVLKFPASFTQPYASPPAFPPAEIIPADWMPWAQMQRIIVHWTGGANRASARDRKHYHLLVEGDGKLVQGDHPITANAAPIRGSYAAHTLNCNSGSIGVALCGMAGAVESPFDPGKSPITMQQWAALPQVLASLCRRYSIPVTPATVLSHAEVQATLGIAQRGKWDIARLPFDPALKGAKAIGDQLRAAVRARL